MSRKLANIRKLLPFLALGVTITLLAAWFNYLTYTRRIPDRAGKNHSVVSSAREVEDVQYHAPSVIGTLADLINISDDFIQDIMFAIRGQANFPSTKSDIIVVAIDKDSLMHHGAWPWSYADIAKLMDKVSTAKVIGLDLLLPEPDRSSFTNVITRYQDILKDNLDLEALSRKSDIHLDTDRLLGEKIAANPTVLGTILFDGPFPSPRARNLTSNYPPQIKLPSGATVQQSEVLLKGLEYILTDIPQLRDVTPPPQGEGFVNLFPSPRDLVRSIPLFAHVIGSSFTNTETASRVIVPAFVLATMRVFLGGNKYQLNLRGDQIHIPNFTASSPPGDRYAIQSVAILKDDENLMTIPLSEVGEMKIRHSIQQQSFTTLPAWEVLDGLHSALFADKIVIIGGTVPGVGYTASTGISDLELSVIESHAAMLSAMLQKDFMDGGYRNDYLWQQAGILASGLAVTVAIIFGNLAVGTIMAALTMLALVVCNFFLFFLNGIDVGITLPIISTLTVMVVLMLANYLMVGRERRFIRKAFQLNVSPSILGYLESHPDWLSSLQGDYRHMTVMFTDIRGFTAIAEKLSPPDLARFLNEYFTPMSDIVMDNMGTVDKFIGDGMMAFWNAPADNPHHARNAALSALVMIEKLTELQHGWTSRGLPQIAIGCGINTGPMFAGYMGSEQRKNYTVMGDSVNIASRLESINKVYSSSILITQSTRDELGGGFVCRVVDKVRVSGKVTALVIYELLGRDPVSEEISEEIAAFSRVFELYQEREFATAESLLKELVFIRPSPLYTMYLDRLAIYKALPPPPDWDGTFSMSNK